MLFIFAFHFCTHFIPFMVSRKDAWSILDKFIAEPLVQTN